MPQPTLYTWVQKGRLSCRNVGSRSKRGVLVRADPETVAALLAAGAKFPDTIDDLDAPEEVLEVLRRHGSRAL